jgi:hypothetical protein
MYEIDGSIGKLETSLARMERCMYAKPGMEEIDRILAIIDHRSHY